MNFNDLMPYLVFGIVLAIIIVGFVYGRISDRKRMQALQGLAPLIGFSYQGEDWGSPARAPHLATNLFDRGHDKRYRNIMVGSHNGFAVSIFDYRFTTGGGKNSKTWNQTVAAFSQNVSLPMFELRPEGFFDRVADTFTHKDIDFDSNPSFSRRYLLRGGEPEKVRGLFTPSLLGFLEGLAPDPKWHIEGDGGTLVLYCSDQTVAPEAVRRFLEEASSIAGTFLNCCGVKKLS